MRANGDGAHVPSHTLRLEIERLKAQLAERDAAIADRNARIEKLARDLATLEEHVKRLLAGRRGGHTVPEGQGLLFPNNLEPASSPDPESDETPEGGDEEDDGEPDDQPQRAGASPGPRRPRKIDTSGLPCEERIHELPEVERICPDSGQVRSGCRDSQS